MNAGQIQSTFVIVHHLPRLTFATIFRIARYHYYFNVSSPKGRRELFLCVCVFLS